MPANIRLPRQITAALLSGLLLLTVGASSALAQSASPGPARRAHPPWCRPRSRAWSPSRSSPTRTSSAPVATPWQWIEVAPDGKTLTVYFWNGASGCYGLKQRRCHPGRRCDDRHRVHRPDPRGHEHDLHRRPVPVQHGGGARRARPRLTAPSDPGATVARVGHVPRDAASTSSGTSSPMSPSTPSRRAPSMSSAQRRRPRPDRDVRVVQRPHVRQSSAPRDGPGGWAPPGARLVDEVRLGHEPALRAVGRVPASGPDGALAAAASATLSNEDRTCVPISSAASQRVARWRGRCPGSPRGRTPSPPGTGWCRRRAPGPAAAPGSGCARRGTAAPNQLPASSRATSSRVMSRTGPWPSVVRSTRSSWSITRWPSRVRWTSASMASAPAATAASKAAIVCSGMVVQWPRCASVIGRSSRRQGFTTGRSSHADRA